MVPVLVDGDFSLGESTAIMQYLADQVPGNDLFPQAPVHIWRALKVISLRINLLKIEIPKNRFRKSHAPKGAIQAILDKV